MMIKGYNLAPDFEGVVVNVSVMVVTKKGTHETDLTGLWSFREPIDTVNGEAASHAVRTLTLAIADAQKAGIL